MSIKLEKKFAFWHGIPREKIPWFPTIDEEKCIGCKLCFVSCGRNVFDFDFKKNKPLVENPYHCLVGCSTCATVCPAGAISFPSRKIIEDVEREYKVLRMMRQEALEKKTKLDLERTRKEVLETLSNAKRKIKYEVAGHIAERQLLAKIQNFINEKPCDIVDIKLETPSLKGCWNEKAPSFISFNLISTEYEDVTPCAEGIESIISEEEMVLVKKE